MLTMLTTPPRVRANAYHVLTTPPRVFREPKICLRNIWTAPNRKESARGLEALTLHIMLYAEKFRCVKKVWSRWGCCSSACKLSCNQQFYLKLINLCQSWCCDYCVLSEWHSQSNWATSGDSVVVTATRPVLWRHYHHGAHIQPAFCYFRCFDLPGARTGRGDGDD